MSEVYKNAGVDIEAGDLLVEKIKKKVRSTYGERVHSGVGGFACLYEMGERFLAAGTDGVGTKLKLAIDLDEHSSVGIDLVAMCVNDILCTGAKPLFFMDYLATGKLNVGQSEKIIEGVVEGCLQSECALIGGETAEMPGMYQQGDYDLAGFAVGEVDKNKLIDGSGLKDGDSLIGLKSSGFHSNGFSLIRKHVKGNEVELMKELLTPTKIYWKAVSPLLDSELLNGLAHITGGGFLNIARVNSNFDYKISFDDFDGLLTNSMKEICNRVEASKRDLFQTFNMGIGMVLMTSQPDKVLELLKSMGEEPYLLGKLVKGDGNVYLGDSLL